MNKLANLTVEQLRAENERLPARTGKAAHRPYITDEREWADFQAWRAARKQEGGR